MPWSWTPGTICSAKFQNGSNSFQKSTIWAFFPEIVMFFCHWNTIFKSIVPCLLNFLSQIMISNKEILVFKLRKGHNNKNCIWISCKSNKGIFVKELFDFFWKITFENHEMAFTKLVPEKWITKKQRSRIL